MRVLEAQPVGIPDWAFEKGLVVCARRNIVTNYIATM